TPECKKKRRVPEPPHQRGAFGAVSCPVLCRPLPQMGGGGKLTRHIAYVGVREGGDRSSRIHTFNDRTQHYLPRERLRHDWPPLHGPGEMLGSQCSGMSTERRQGAARRTIS